MTADTNPQPSSISSVQALPPENWTEPQTILVILAHPDDPEFFCGATIARWTRLGHTVHYCLLTRGDKGVRDQAVNLPGLL
jgi:LmbE family N-acetylglucosaminyl deacetylase